MHELIHLLNEPLTIGAVVLVCWCGLLAMVVMWVSTRSARAQLDAVSVENLASTNLSDGPERALERTRLESHEADANGRIVLANSPQSALRAWVDDAILVKWRFEAGPWLTGLALMCTFFLIALVLARDVGPAIDAGSTSGMARLSTGVSTMGAKFMVSIAGIVMSIIHGMVRAHWVSTLHAAAADTAARLSQEIVTVDDLRLETLRRTTELNAAMLDALNVQKQMLSGGFASLESAIGELSSIDVSVKVSVSVTNR